ncbi:hypothetical protein CEK25_012183 [Fusarium fujikuroi]|nr:hypothetical protein CEK25_012183 [Fusarium fujikuroi]
MSRKVAPDSARLHDTNFWIFWVLWNQESDGRTASSTTLNYAGTTVGTVGCIPPPAVNVRTSINVSATTAIIAFAIWPSGRKRMTDPDRTHITVDLWTATSATIVEMRVLSRYA